VGSLEIRQLTRWQRYVIPSRMRKARGSRYACFPLILKMLSIGSPTTTCFKYSRDTALEMHLSLYEGATSIVQINGHQYSPIPIPCAVRQGFPMSMALYTLSSPIPSPSGPETTRYKDRTPHTPQIGGGLGR